MRVYFLHDETDHRGVVVQDFPVNFDEPVKCDHQHSLKGLQFSAFLSDSHQMHMEVVFNAFVVDHVVSHKDVGVFLVFVLDEKFFELVDDEHIGGLIDIGFDFLVEKLENGLAKGVEVFEPAELEELVDLFLANLLPHSDPNLVIHFSILSIFF